MECLECGSPIIGRRSDSKYCSKTCSGRAKNRRADQRLISKATQQYPAAPHIAPMVSESSLYGFTEIRELEKDKFATVLDLKEKYENQIRTLETNNLNKDFEIQRLKDQKDDLIRNHEKELQNATTNTVKETVNAISMMPAVQGALGSLASNLISSKNDSLGGLENTMSETEKQIIQSVRKMQPDAQNYLVQMLYFLFAKKHEEQMEIFTTLTTYLQSGTNENDENDLP